MSASQTSRAGRARRALLRPGVVAVIAVGSMAAGCGDGGPSAPTPIDATSQAVKGSRVQPGFAGGTTAGGLAVVGSDSGAGALNDPPRMVLTTRPAAAPGDPYPVISGKAPLTVEFNLCQSSDPDQVLDDEGRETEAGDSLNHQFHFGDSGSSPFSPDGSFNPDFEHFCRVEHTYETAGRYVATVSVTDKHLEDQSGGVVALARVTERVTIDLVSADAGGAPGYGTFDGALTASDPLYDPPDVEGEPLPPCVTVGFGDAFYYDVFPFVHPGGPLDVEITAASFDTWINLYSPSFDAAQGCSNLVASDDDGGSGVLSRITGSFPRGGYVLVVTSFNAFDTGSYTVSIGN